MDGALLTRLGEWIAIPSISADAAHAADVRLAGEWLCAQIRAAGGDAELADWEGHPLALGELRASAGADSAPTVLCYGHFDVLQPPDPLELWETPPFGATVRDNDLRQGGGGRRGQLFLLRRRLLVSRQARELPVNVRFACDGEEETGGHSIVDYLAGGRARRGRLRDLRRRDGRPGRAGVQHRDSRPLLPASHVADRRAAACCSNVYGGAALNAVSTLAQVLQALLPGDDGRLPEPLRRGLAAERGGAGGLGLPCRRAPTSSRVKERRPMDAAAAVEFYPRTWAEPALDVNGIAGGSALLQKTVLPVEAVANVSIRLASGQEPDTIAAEAERLLRKATPEGAELADRVLVVERARSRRPVVESSPARRRSSEHSACVRC